MVQAVMEALNTKTLRPDRQFIAQVGRIRETLPNRL